MGTHTDLRSTVRDAAPRTRRIGEIGLDDVPSVGGMGANLGELTRCGLPAPRGFVVTAGSFTAATGAAGCRAELTDGTRAAPSLGESELAEFAERARGLVRAAGAERRILMSAARQAAR